MNMKKTKAFKRMVAKEQREHPQLSKKQAEQIVRQHQKKK
jgi:hypothetical protein